MSSMTVAVISFACFSGAALSGLVVRKRLPDHHLNEDSRDIVKLGAGLIATLAAMILGLLISSAKGTLDTMNSALMQDGARIIQLDRVLAGYGPEAAEARGMLKAAVVHVLDRVWPEKSARPVNLGAVEVANHAEELQKKLKALAPRNAEQQRIQAQALQIVADLAQSRWNLLDETELTLPTPFLVVLLFWLTILFAAFGLLSPGNATVNTVLFLCALSLAGAIFIIMEMNTPVTGIIRVSAAPLQKALANIGR